MRLPTMDEWEIAARLGSPHKSNFWDDIIQHIHQYAHIDTASSFAEENRQTTSPVGLYKASPAGLYDIYGNIFEFCLDASDDRTKEHIAVTKGGSWASLKEGIDQLNPLYNRQVDKRASYAHQGFRVVRGKVPAYYWHGIWRILEKE